MQKRCLDAEQIFVIEGFLTPQECAAFVALSEQSGYEEATLSTPDGPLLEKGIRDNARVIRDDPRLAADWWARARPFFPADINGWAADGLNERFRFYRYDPRQKFGAHFDGYVQRSEDEQTHYTFMVYLNDDFRGGETVFYDLDGNVRLTVRPERGLALAFVHRQLHEGAAVKEGRKYVLRTDVFYAFRG